VLLDHDGELRFHSVETGVAVQRDRLARLVAGVAAFGDDDSVDPELEHGTRRRCKIGRSRITTAYSRTACG
jgi:hypothetical protein